jgi:acid phosphatase (class A)
LIRSLLVIGAALAAAAAAPAPKAPLDPSMASPPAHMVKGYLAADALDSVGLLGPPPAAESPRGQADRTIYLETRALAGGPRWKAAQRDNDLWYGGALARYACALGKDIGDRSTPVTARMLHRVERDVATVGSPAKNRYNRVRPLIGDERPVCIPREDWMKTNGSYPSGHAATGWAWGLILGEAQPAKASAVIEAGREIGDSRVICGVHYQSVVEAGRILAAAMVARLHADPAFRKDLAAAKMELARAKRPPPHCPA